MRLLMHRYQPQLHGRLTLKPPQYVPLEANKLERTPEESNNRGINSNTSFWAAECSDYNKTVKLR